jgi:DmsE family decaheme c-type cytochrome
MSRVLGALVVIAALMATAVLLPTLGKAQSPPASAPPAPQVAQTAPAGAAGAMPTGYAGAEACKGCHEEAYNKFAQTRMGRLFLKQARSPRENLACENCHGPGKAHADAGGGKGKGGMISFARDDKTPVEVRNQICLDCHAKGNRVFWKGSSHEARDVACTSCHTVMEDHSPRSQLAKATEIETCQTCHLQQARARQWRSSHMPLREGKMSCTSCHNPHGTVHQALLRETSLNETCYRCHAEKRGPFLWEHAPVGESCANCHDPHGSNHEKMLKVVKPRLCQQCHVESRHPTNPYGLDASGLRYTRGASCTNCHVNIHGSNHPSGFAFTR